MLKYRIKGAFLHVLTISTVSNALKMARYERWASALHK